MDKVMKILANALPRYNRLAIMLSVLMLGCCIGVISKGVIEARPQFSGELVEEKTEPETTGLPTVAIQLPDGFAELSTDEKRKLMNDLRAGLITAADLNEYKRMTEKQVAEFQKMNPQDQRKFLLEQARIKLEPFENVSNGHIQGSDSPN